RTDELEAAREQILAQCVGFGRAGRNVAQRRPMIDTRCATHEPPDVGVERAELLPDAEERARVADRALDLEAVADDAGILQQTFDARRREPRDARRIELGECPAVIVALLEDRGPAESRLSALERQELEENAVVMHGHA